MRIKIIRNLARAALLLGAAVAISACVGDEGAYRYGYAPAVSPQIEGPLGQPRRYTGYNNYNNYNNYNYNSVGSPGLDHRYNRGAPYYYQTPARSYDYNSRYDDDGRNSGTFRWGSDRRGVFGW